MHDSKCALNELSARIADAKHSNVKLTLSKYDLAQLSWWKWTAQDTITQLWKEPNEQQREEHLSWSWSDTSVGFAHDPDTNAHGETRDVMGN